MKSFKLLFSLIIFITISLFSTFSYAQDDATEKTVKESVEEKGITNETNVNSDTSLSKSEIEQVVDLVDPHAAVFF